MSISGIGKAEDLEKYWSPELSKKTERLEISSVNRRHATPVIEEYPYPQQIILSGEFVYHQKGRKGFSPTVNGTYEYRSASGIFLLQVQQNNMDVKKIFEEINSATSEITEIRQITAINRRSLWNFFDEADQVVNAKIRGKKGERSLRSEIRETSESDSESSEIGTYELRENLKEYLLVSAKAKFTSPESEEPFIIKYNKGRFEIPIEPEDGVEYVIQLLERDVISENE
jgi:hypothetical protein